MRLGQPLSGAIVFPTVKGLGNPLSGTLTFPDPVATKPQIIVIITG